ncbi:hypothetical protein J6590_058504 [Homalodisca vitripennis]|nr:hypothetical protein J6590_058504 [Homalodisca vitripennis]
MIEFFSKLNLRTNNSKSNALNFCLRQREIEDRAAVMADDVLIEETDSTKFLGMYLEKSQKKAVRIISKLKSRNSCRDAFRELGLLTLPCLYILDVAVFCRFKCEFVRGRDVYQYGTRGRDNLRQITHKTFPGSPPNEICGRQITHKTFPGSPPNEICGYATATRVYGGAVQISPPVSGCVKSHVSTVVVNYRHPCLRWCRTNLAPVSRWCRTISPHPCLRWCRTNLATVSTVVPYKSHHPCLRWCRTNLPPVSTVVPYLSPPVSTVAVQISPRLRLCVQISPPCLRWCRTNIATRVYGSAVQISPPVSTVVPYKSHHPCLRWCRTIIATRVYGCAVQISPPVSTVVPY